MDGGFPFWCFQEVPEDAAESRGRSPEPTSLLQGRARSTASAKHPGTLPPLPHFHRLQERYFCLASHTSMFSQHSQAPTPPFLLQHATFPTDPTSPSILHLSSFPLENHITIQPCSPPKKFAVAWLPVLITCTQSGRFLLGFFSLPMTVGSPAFASRAISHCLAEACHSLVLSILYLTLELSERRSESVH